MHDSPSGSPPLRLPHVSPRRLAALRRLFAVLQRISTALAAALALRLFLHPQRRALRDDDAVALGRARQHQLGDGSSRVNVFEWGDGERTALIMHGWGSRAARFAPMAEALAARGWRVLALDAPAHGDLPGTCSSLPQFIAAIDAVAARFGPLHALVGHSLGALAVACRFCQGAPPWAASVRAVVLISTPSGAPFLVDQFVGMLGIATPARTRMLARFRRRFDAGPEHFLALPGVRHIDAPVLLVHDRADDVVPHAHSAMLHSALPTLQLVTTSGLGHSALTRDPHTLDTILSFLESPQAAGATAPPAVRRADLTDATDAAAIVQLLDAYARDPRGGGTPLPDGVRAQLVPGLLAHPMARVWLAFDGGNAVGVCVAFIGFSTFHARPLLNIHDLAVLREQRGRGTGQALLAAAEALARETGCCRLTLEVQDDNAPARRLYARMGFRDVHYGDSGPTRFLARPLGNPSP